MRYSECGSEFVALVLIVGFMPRRIPGSHGPQCWMWVLGRYLGLLVLVPPFLKPFGPS
jgi:hypothetical protein